MRITLVVVFAVLTGSFHSATSTGSALTSKANGHSLHAGTLDSPFSLDNDVSRILLQEPEDRCPECSTIRQVVYNETLGAWLVDDSVLDRSNIDLQCIVSCANESETLMLSFNRILKPSRTITIDKPLIITGLHDEVLANEGIYPAAENKTVISCPEGSDQGIFDIQSGGVTIANLEIKDCSLEGDASPMAIRNCERSTDGIRIHHVDFTNNVHSSEPVAINYVKSFSCGTLEMTNVNFRDNQVNGSAKIARLGSATVMKDVTFENNTRTDNGTEKAAFVFTTSGTQSGNLTINGLVATENQMPILKAKSRTIEILNSDFGGNDLGTQTASMFQFSPRSKIVIKDCTFGNNTGTGKGMIAAESTSSFEIFSSRFTRNTKFGSVVFSTGSKLNIQDSRFTANNGAVDGGVMYLAGSTARLTKTVFTDNRSGGKGGSVFAINDSSLIVQNSKFTKNKGREGGCFYIENSNVSIVGSLFRRNKADIDGGAIRVEQGGCICEDSMFEENSSLDEGGAIHIENATYVTMQSLTFASRDAAFGSVVRIDKSRTNVNLKDVHFRGGVVELTGAALYVDDSNVTIDGATFINNTGPYGGAIYAQKFDIAIRNARFLSNTATVMGGAISGDNGNVTFENTTFDGNLAYLGGALHFYTTKFEASEVVFLNNHASEGGGLLCKDSNVTITPRRGADGKLPPSAEGNPSYSFGIYARNNTGIDSGGAIDAIDSSVRIAYGNFSANTAPDGGAIQATSSKLTSIDISYSWFGDNIADVRGGGVAVRSANEGNMRMKLTSTKFSLCIADQGGALFLMSVNATLKDCNFVNNTAVEGGAAFFRKNLNLIGNNENETDSASIRITVKDCLFQENNASDHGGAVMARGEIKLDRKFIRSEEGSSAPVFAETGFTLELNSVYLTGNQAYISGGGVYAEAASLEVRQAKVTNNTAPQGGGFYLMRSTANIDSSNIFSNQAEKSGGGILMARQSNGTIVRTNFTDNSLSEKGEGGGLSLSGAGVRGQNLIFAQNNAASGGGVSLAPGSKRTSRVETKEVDSSFLCFECIFTKNNASTSGGGLNVQSQDSDALVVAQLERCQFEDNSASVFGGGIHFVRSFNQTKCTDWTSCSHLVILNSSFTTNKAARSGGSLLTNDWNRVLFSCSQSTDNTNSLEFVSKTRVSSLQRYQQGLCPQWIDAESHAMETPSLVSSYARECLIKDVKDRNRSEIDSRSIQINETVPGERLPDIFIECYDEFDALAKSAGNELTATLKSTQEASLMGIFVTNLQDGVGKFTGVRNPSKETFDGSYSYELEISFSLDYLKPIKVLMNVRGCRINEQKEDEGVQCKQCDATQYNFNPMDETCKSCDDTLNCESTYVLPEDDYWHLSPCHVPAQKCLTSYACEETADLQEKINGAEFGNILTALQNYSCDFSNASIEEYQKLQCKEGYEGVLCGSCKEDYGRTLSFACTKCEHPAISVLILGSLCIWLALVAAITIRGSMTIEERLVIIRKQLSNLTSRQNCRIQRSQSEATGEDDKHEEEDKEKTRVVPFANAAHRRALKAASKLSAMFQWIRQNQTDDVTTAVETPEEIDNLRLSQLAKWKLCEVFKVAVNFMQAISVAAVINVEWTTYMLTMFDLSAFAGGGSTAFATRAIQCFPWWNGTRYATYAGLATGLLVPIFVILCIVAFFAFLAYKASKGMYYFVKRSALATLAICYFSYLSITKIAVMVFYCIGVRTDDDFSSEKETHYWALDTSIECAEQDHIALMVFGGLLFALFSVGFPLISAFILVLCRKGNGSRDPQWMSDILGFLYRAYKTEFVYWESTVMLRKALLSVIAVFSYHLGGHSQGLLASCILSVCLFLQAIYKPYRVEFEMVNNIESLSLLLSGLTFTLAQFFTKDRTNEAVKVALSVSLMTSIIVFLAYLLLRMLVCVIDVLRTDLRVVGQLTDTNSSTLSIVGTWITSRFGLSERTKTDEDKEDVEMGSLNGKNAAGDEPNTSA